MNRSAAIFMPLCLVAACGWISYSIYQGNQQGERR